MSKLYAWALVHPNHETEFVINSEGMGDPLTQGDKEYGYQAIALFTADEPLELIDPNVYLDMIKADWAKPLSEQLRLIDKVGPYHLRDVPSKAAAILEMNGN